MNQTLLNPQCSAQSFGPANALFIQLIQTIITAHCNIAPGSWPEDYGPTAEENGKDFYQ